MTAKFSADKNAEPPDLPKACPARAPPGSQQHAASALEDGGEKLGWEGQRVKPARA